MTFYTGIKFFADNLGIEYDKILAAFSFYSGYESNALVYPEKWSGSNSATGYLNIIGGTFYTTGGGFFDGSKTMSLRGQNFALTEDSTFFISYQKLRTGSEILLSSATGTNFNNCQGYCLGVNDANKLYLKYWNPVEGQFTFTYSKILSDKNLIVVNRTNSILSIGRYDNNKLSYDLEQFSIFNNAFKNNDSGSLFLGGHPSNINWMDSSSNNFSGFVDKFYFFSSLPFQYSNTLTSGLYSIPTGYDGYTETFCYTTGYNFNSGFSYTGVTGVFVSGFSSGVSGITGYTTGLSGYSYSGITGYAQNSLGIYVDNCGNSQILYQQVPVSGLISGTYITAIPLTGFTYITGTQEIVLSGILSGFSGIYIIGQVCDNIFNITGDILYDINKSYLSSLSYSQISLLSNVEQNKDTVEIYNEPYQNTPLNYNTNLLYDNVNSYYANSDILNPDKILLFANGQSLIQSGYELESNGYNTEIHPKFDFFITGNRVETNKFFDEANYLFYDDIEIQNYYIFTGISNKILSGNFNENAFIFRNGQKLVKNVDYLFKGPLSTYPFNFAQKLSGDSASDQFGHSVATNGDGTVIVMGGIGNDGGILVGSGAALVFTGNSTVGWTQKQKLSGDSAGDEFGYSVATNGDSSIIVVGARFDDPNGLSNAGAALVFTGNSAVGWTQVQKLSGDSAGDQFGVSVAINGDGTVIVMGGPFDSPGGLTNAGSALVFTGNSTVGWRQAQKLSGDSVVDNFGYSVATNGDGTVIIMGGPSDDPNSLSSAGSALVFTGNSTIGWRQAQKLSGDSAQDQFGYSVATNGNGTVIVMGGVGNDGGTTIGSGAALVFTGNSTVGWTQKQKLSGDSANDRFGYSVATNSDGTVIVMGGIGNDGGTTVGSGAVLVFTGNSTVGWTQKQKLSGDSAQDQFGYSVATNDDGTVIVMGGIGNDGGTTIGSGAAMIFTAPKEVVLNDTNIYDNDDKFLLVESNNNYNRSLTSGGDNSSTINLNYNFNNGCSQVYLNGIRQKINNNYIENSNYDLISGNYTEPSVNSIIYNNTNDYFV